MRCILPILFVTLIMPLHAIPDEPATPLEFDKQKADFLYHFAYQCIDQEYPNKLGQVLGNDSYLAPPRDLHPAFYGCFDWHSSVHGHWTLVTILQHFPDHRYHKEILEKLRQNITRENILKEVAYFNDVHNNEFERTYGWAWLLKLDEALLEWNSPDAREMHENLLPLVDLISNKFIGFLDKLIYPIRVGEHTNTAFGMAFAYDYAKKFNVQLAAKIEEKAREYYINDCNCPVTWEPGGFDFLSPCLQEALLMMKVLPEQEYGNWLDSFMPGFSSNPEDFFEPAVVSDRSDGKLAHLDGLNFSRAWCLFEMGKEMQNEKFKQLGIGHFNFSFEKMDADEYAGAHWLASFATYALLKAGAYSGDK